MRDRFFANPKVFDIIKSTMNNEFIDDLGKVIPQMFVPKIFFQKFGSILDYEEHIKNVEELKIIENLNELNQNKAKRKENQQKKMEEKRPEWEKQLRLNKSHNELRKLTKHESQLVEDLPNVKSEKARKDLLHCIKNHFENYAKKDEILVVDNIAFMRLKDKDMKPYKGVDCVLVNFTKMYIMPMKAKATFHKSGYEQAMKVLDKCCELFTDWLGGEVEIKDWRLIPVAFFDNKSDECDGILKDVCEKCKKHIIFGAEMSDQMKHMLDGIESRNTQPEAKAWTRFQNIAEYLLFLMPQEPVATPMKISNMQMEKSKEMYLRKRLTDNQ